VTDRALAVPDVQIDNDRVRVTEWRFEPGAATGHHRHEFDYVVVPITTGSLTLREDSSDRVAAITSGQAYFREAGVEHDVINETDQVVVFIEIEFKTS
jgi:beta-alanine degradation protein BauB